MELISYRILTYNNYRLIFSQYYKFFSRFGSNGINVPESTLLRIARYIA